MSADEAPVTEVRAGMSVALGPGTQLTFKAVAADTANAFALMEYILAPGGGAGLHTHTREDESFYVLAGELAVQLAEEAVAVTPGEFVHIPRGTPHAFVNQGREPVTALVILTPAGLEQFFVDLAALAAAAPDGQIAPETLDALTARYGLEFA